MKHRWTIVRGATRAEFRMQLHRPAMWLALTFLAVVSLPFKGGLPDLLSSPPADLIPALCRWGVTVNFLLLLGVGFFMADRLPRDRRTRVDELFASTADGLGARCTGKWLGSLGATLVPVSLFYFLGVAGVFLHLHDPAAIGLGILIYAAIVLPGALFVGAFSLACTAIIWVPLYQFLFAGYWLWGNAFPPYPHVPFPTLSGTVLTPVGSAISVGIFGVPAFGLYHLPLIAGIASLLLLPGLAALALVALTYVLRWQAAQR